MNTTDLQNDLKEFQEDLEEYGNYRYSYFIEVTCNMDLFFKKRQLSCKKLYVCILCIKQ